MAKLRSSIPNIPLQELFKTEKYKKTELKFYTQSSLSFATGLPLALIRMARSKNFDGFRSNNKIAWAEFKPCLEARAHELDSMIPHLTLKEELVKRDIKIKDLTIRKMERNLLEPEDVKRLLVELAAKTSAVLKKELLELPPRLAGKSEPDVKIELDKSLERIFEVLKSAERDVTKLQTS